LHPHLDLHRHCIHAALLDHHLLHPLNPGFLGNISSFVFPVLFVWAMEALGFAACSWLGSAVAAAARALLQRVSRPGIVARFF
jgi:hypothetical protein